MEMCWTLRSSILRFVLLVVALVTAVFVWRALSESPRNHVMLISVLDPDTRALMPNVPVELFEYIPGIFMPDARSLGAGVTQADRPLTIIVRSNRKGFARAYCKGPLPLRAYSEIDFSVKTTFIEVSMLASRYPCRE